MANASPQQVHESSVLQSVTLSSNASIVSLQETVRVELIVTSLQLVVISCLQLNNMFPLDAASEADFLALWISIKI